MANVIYTKYVYMPNKAPNVSCKINGGANWALAKCHSVGAKVRNKKGRTDKGRHLIHAIPRKAFKPPSWQNVDTSPDPQAALRGQDGLYLPSVPWQQSEERCT